MPSSMSIQSIGFEKAEKILGRRFKPFMNEATKRVGLELRDKSTENIKSRIYRQPESPTYMRTGRALGGGAVYEENDAARVVHDTTLKGARKDYAPMLNKNRRIRRLHTLFWDDAVKQTNRKSNLNKIVKPVYARFIRG